MFRKYIPNSIEMVNKGDKVILLNTSTWDNRSYDINIYGENGFNKNVTLLNINKHLIIGDIVSGKNYTINLSRNDLLGKIIYKGLRYKFLATEKPYIVLVGASIGKAWELPSLPQRINYKMADFGYRGSDSFEKGNVINQLLNSVVKPDVVIIKECAAYFPRDTNESLKNIIIWVDLLRRGNIVPILSTTVSVTKNNDESNSGRQDSINVFNERLREYAIENNIAILDLQNILKDSTVKGYLREDYAAKDGLHLNKKAYNEKLDQEIKKVVEDVVGDSNNRLLM